MVHLLFWSCCKKQQKPLLVGSGSPASDSADAVLAISDDDSSQERTLFQDITNNPKATPLSPSHQCTFPSPRSQPTITPAHLPNHSPAHQHTLSFTHQTTPHSMSANLSSHTSAYSQSNISAYSHYHTTAYPPFYTSAYPHSHTSAYPTSCISAHQPSPFFTTTCLHSTSAVIPSPFLASIALLTLPIASPIVPFKPCPAPPLLSTFKLCS